MCREPHPPGPLDQLTNGRVATQVEAYHQSIDEESDQVVNEASERPATVAPSGMSTPAPSRDSTTATAACSTMNRVALFCWARANRRDGRPR